MRVCERVPAKVRLLASAYARVCVKKRCMCGVSLFVCVCVCVCLCARAHLCVSCLSERVDVQMSPFPRVYVPVYFRVWKQLRVQMHDGVCEWVFVWARMYVYVYTCVGVQMYVRVIACLLLCLGFIWAFGHVRVVIRVRAWVRVCVRGYVSAHGYLCSLILYVCVSVF